MKECNQCGKCCIKYADGGLSATADEVNWWEAARPEIARFVHNGEIWRDPTTGDALTRCPWLLEEIGTNPPHKPKYSCAIYFDRPDDCKQYPVTITEMVIDECEMIEVRDLTDSHQAQIKLDKIMATSRPAESDS